MGFRGQSPNVVMDRTERLLALVLVQGMKGSTQRDKALALNRAGFSNVEIADLLGTTSATVSASLYQAKSPKKSTSGKKSTAATKKN